MRLINRRVAEKRSRGKRQEERDESRPDESQRRDPRSQDYVRHANIITGRDCDASEPECCSSPSCPLRRCALSKSCPSTALTETYFSRQRRRIEMKSGSVCIHQMAILSW